MIVEPEQRIPDFVKAGADIISVHAEQSSTIHLDRVINQIKDLGVKAGVVLNPGTPLTAIEYVLPIVDLVLIMSVNPGFGGQKFIESQVDKIRKLRALCDEQVGVGRGGVWGGGLLVGGLNTLKNIHTQQHTLSTTHTLNPPPPHTHTQGLNPWIEVDGGVTPANAYKVIDAGANALVAGSAVFGAPDYAEAIKGIKASKAPVNAAVPA